MFLLREEIKQASERASTRLQELVFALLKECQEAQVCGWVILENASSLPRVLLTVTVTSTVLGDLGQSLSSSSDYPVHFQNTLCPFLFPPFLNAQVPGGAALRFLLSQIEDGLGRLPRP